ncbi:PREDICTED: intraflagellar transport protein 57 homolog isoform X2 [Nicrophorus vespilloides]|uniref:Intraflagellar transport protein 57 homolog isoform X2 n=1 Tax=Nicrophorus vespilloides TaxID=110193 RepID=A0ABM1MAD4_NICVS|nr:PREDICTED: intraflagellar transport protein 57 homolog isoform X2 [Nicrophorus vespilloides]
MERKDARIVSEKESPYSGYVIMEDLAEKLKNLGYDRESPKMKPIHKHYFMVQKNPGEQFYLFSSLAAWLIRKSGKSFEQPQEFDDPNTTIANILDVVRNDGLVLEFAPNKLKQGYGDHVVFILDHLADVALEHEGFQWKRAKPSAETEEEAEMIEDESELVLDRVEEEMMAYYSDDEDDPYVFNVDAAPAKKSEVFEINTNINEEEWKLELERVLPQLKVTISNSSRDWRSHLDQMKQYRTTIDQTFFSTKNNLDKLHKNISVAVEKIGNREKYLNRELDAVLDEYRLLQDQLSKVTDNYRNISGGVTERNRDLEQLSVRLESVKQEMEQRGSSMTDGTPLVKIKKGISQIKAQITKMDIRIGVLQCLLLQSKIQEKKLLEDDLGQTIHAF